MNTNDKRRSRKWFLLYGLMLGAVHFVAFSIYSVGFLISANQFSFPSLLLRLAVGLLNSLTVYVILGGIIWYIVSQIKLRILFWLSILYSIIHVVLTGFKSIHSNPILNSTYCGYNNDIIDYSCWPSYWERLIISVLLFYLLSRTIEYFLNLKASHNKSESQKSTQIENKQFINIRRMMIWGLYGGVLWSFLIVAIYIYVFAIGQYFVLHRDPDITIFTYLTKEHIINYIFYCLPYGITVGVVFYSIKTVFQYILFFVFIPFGLATSRGMLLLLTKGPYFPVKCDANNVCGLNSIDILFVQYLPFAFLLFLILPDIVTGIKKMINE